MSSNRSGIWRFLVVGLWLGACGGAIGQTTIGGESHFLQECGDGCGSGLECVSGLCTRSCLVGKSQCNDLSPSAVCTDASIEPGAVAVCDVGCSSNAGCGELGRGFRCQAGFCRDSLEPVGVAGTSGTGGALPTAGAAATAGTTSNAGASGAGTKEADLYVTPNCAGAEPTALCPLGLLCIGDPRTIASAEPTGICVEGTVVEQCADDENACPAGFECVSGACSPNRVSCVLPGGCPESPEASCPYGYARARVAPEGGVENCTGPCVPLTHCDCSSDDGCPAGSVCRAGQCLAELPWQPPSYCSLPFDRGMCDDVLPVWAAVNGQCTKVTYGGCGGNDNRFYSLEECLSVCEGTPLTGSCPDGRRERRICTACGLADGCAKLFTACALPCAGDDECSGVPGFCIDGFCQDGPCG